MYISYFIVSLSDIFVPVVQHMEDFGFTDDFFRNNTVGLDFGGHFFEFRVTCAQAASLFEQGRSATIIVPECIIYARVCIYIYLDMYTCIHILMSLHIHAFSLHACYH